jgi:arylsulfatase A-like enzyme
MAISRRTFVSALAASFGTGAGAFAQATAPAILNLRKRAPNLVILLCYDLGYGDIGCYGNRTIRTPNIDSMAAQGTRLTEFYATPTCTPSRAALLTGRLPVRSGLTRVLIPNEHYGIPGSEITLPECLQRNGYRSACIGKWHLGNRLPYRPMQHGFDEFYGLLYSNDMTLPLVKWPPVKLFHGGRVIESPVRQSTLTQRLTGEAMRFIQENRQNPFLLYLPYTMPHLPWSASPQFAGKSAYGPYGDAVEEIDWGVGQILSELARHGLEEDTMVAFLSDNGPELQVPAPGGSAGGLRGGKGSTWEGGVRVPCVVRWPGRVAAGKVRPGIAGVADLFTTYVHAGGGELPRDHVVDGRNLLPFLEGKSESPHQDHYYFLGRNLAAVRSDEWKMHLFKREQRRKGGYRDPVPCNPPELYNLARDPGETRNLYGEHPEIVDRLFNVAGQLQRSIVAGPVPPPYWRSLFPGKNP